MNLFPAHTTYPNKTKSYLDILEAMRPKSHIRTEIEADMSTQEIAEIVSEKLMQEIRRQFAETKKRFEAAATAAEEQ